MSQAVIDSTIKLAHVTGKQLGDDLTFTFANNDAANTQKVETIDRPNWANKNYKFTVVNPSTATDLTIKFFDVENIGGNDVNVYLTSVIVPKSQTITGTSISAYSVIIEGLFTSDKIKIVVSNNTAIGSTGGFIATIRVREV